MRTPTKIIFLFVTLLPLSAFGSGNAAHHGHVSDLLAPFVNVAVLLGFLVWKLKGPLSAHFKKMAAEITNTLERASLKSKEAQVMLEVQQRKMANLDSEIADIRKTSDAEIKTFERNYAKESEERSFKLKADATHKIEAEKKVIISDLNSSLFDMVIGKTKKTIAGNKDYQVKATSKMLSGIQK